MFLQWRVLLPLLDGAHKIHTMISISKLLLHSFWTCKIIPVVSLNITSSWTVRKIISHLDLYLNTCILRMEKIKGAISSGYTHHTLYMTIFKKKKINVKYFALKLLICFIQMKNNREWYFLNAMCICIRKSERKC